MNAMILLLALLIGVLLGFAIGRAQRKDKLSSPERGELLAHRGFLRTLQQQAANDPNTVGFNLTVLDEINAHYANIDRGITRGIT